MFELFVCDMHMARWGIHTYNDQIHVYASKTLTVLYVFSVKKKRALVYPIDKNDLLKLPKGEAAVWCLHLSEEHVHGLHGLSGNFHTNTHELCPKGAVISHRCELWRQTVVSRMWHSYSLTDGPSETSNMPSGIPTLRRWIFQMMSEHILQALSLPFFFFLTFLYLKHKCRAWNNKYIYISGLKYVIQHQSVRCNFCKTLIVLKAAQAISLLSQKNRCRFFPVLLFPLSCVFLWRLNPETVGLFLLIKGKGSLIDKWAVGQAANQRLEFPCQDCKGPWVSHQPREQMV